MSGGLLNRNYRLHLAGEPSRCVLRIYDRSAGACAREVGVLASLRGRVPVPEVLYVGELPENGRPFCVLSFVDGVSLADLRRTGPAHAVEQSAFDAGRLLPRLRELPGPGAPPGFESSITIMELVDLFAARPDFQRRVPLAVLERVRRYVTAWEPRLADLRETPSLVHSDFNARNILVRDTPAGWRVSAILDWEFALSGSPLADIGNFLRYHRPTRPRYEPFFSRGLRAGGMTLPHDWLAMARLLDVPALCEMLARAELPDALAAELLEVLSSSVAGS